MTAKDAVESGRQRLLMEKGDHIKATLQDVPHSDTARSIHLLIDLAGQNKGMLICWSWCLGAQTRATLTRDSMHACPCVSLDTPDSCVFGRGLFAAGEGRRTSGRPSTEGHLAE